MLKFTKIHGIGNDYIYINLLEEKVSNIKELAIRLSDRHFGVGSDGIIYIDKSETADFKMRIFNPDGSEAEMCGNGIRGIGKYLYDKKLTSKDVLSIETNAGIKYLKLNIDNGSVFSVCVDMGKYKYIKELSMPVGKKIYDLNCISMGNPHAITFVDSIDKINLNKVGKFISENEQFPNRTNVEFVKIIDKNNIDIRVYERGVGETLACGTGACASVVSAYLNDYVENNVVVRLPGGSLEIYIDKTSNNVYMTGPTEIVYEGKIENL